MFSISNLLSNQQNLTSNSVKSDASIHDASEKQNLEKNSSLSLSDYIFSNNARTNHFGQTTIGDSSQMLWMNPSTTLAGNDPNLAMNSQLEQFLMMAKRSCKFLLNIIKK